MGIPDIGKVSSVVADPWLSNLFTFEIPNVPTGAQDEEKLVVQCQQTSLPGWTINQVEVALFGHTLEYAGNLTYTHDLSTTYVDNSKGEIRRIFEKWGAICRNGKTQLGDYKNKYSRTAKLTIYDTAGNAVMVYSIYGLWPSQLPDAPLDGSSSNAISHGIGFKLDWYEKTGGSTA